MFIHLHPVLILVGVIAPIVATAVPTAGCERGDIAFRKTMKSGREVVVTRGASLPANELVGIVPDAHLRELNSAFPLRVELRSGSASSIPMASRIVLVRNIPGRGFGGFEVFDALFDAGELVLASGENGEIVLWHVTVLGLTRCAVLRNSDWTLFAALVPLDKNAVGVELGLTEDHRVEAAVSDLRPHFKQHTRFVQIEKEAWKFKRVDARSVQKSK